MVNKKHDNIGKKFSGIPDLKVGNREREREREFPTFSGTGIPVRITTVNFL
jgi:hypothetical protein